MNGPLITEALSSDSVSMLQLLWSREDLSVGLRTDGLISNGLLERKPGVGEGGEVERIDCCLKTPRERERERERE